MKHNTLIILLAVLVLALTIPGALAQTFPTGGVSGIQVVNLATSEAIVSATYYAEDGTKYTLLDQTLAAQGDSYTYYSEPKATGNFLGAVILSAAGQIAGISNTVFNNGAGGAYGGANVGSTTVLLPLVTKAFGGQSTAIGIQNTDTVNSVTANVIYTPQGGSSFLKTYPLQPGSSQIIDLGLDTDFSAAWIGSASISPADGSTPLVASALIYTSQVVFAYSGFANTGTEWYLPLIRSNFPTLSTGVQVVNATASDVEVTMSYSGNVYNINYEIIDVGYTCIVDATLPASRSVTFYNLDTWPFDDVFGASAASITGGDCQANGDASFSDAGYRFLGSAIVTTDGAVAAVVNDADISGSTSGAYNGALATDAAASVISPLARVQFYGFTSGTQVQNICNSSVTASATYYTSPVSQNQTAPVLPNAIIAAGASYTFFTNDNAYAGWLGSVIVSTAGGDCLVGITNDAPVSGDSSVFNLFAMP